jgi:hypothetical protein
MMPKSETAKRFDKLLQMMATQPEPLETPGAKAPSLLAD